MVAEGINGNGDLVGLRIVISDMGDPLAEGERFDFTQEAEAFNEAWKKLLKP